MSREKIEVITYEQDRLNYFTDLMEKAQKSYDRLYKKYIDSPYLFDGTTILSDAGRELSFYKDVVDMLKKCYRKQSEGEWIDKPTGAYGRMQSWCSACGKHSGIGGIESNRHKPYCPHCGAKMKGGE